MKFLIIVVLLGVVALINVYFGRKTQNNIGENIGDKHMKEHWGIDEEKIEDK